VSVIEKPSLEWYAHALAGGYIKVAEYQLNLDAVMNSTQNDFHAIHKAKTQLKIQRDHVVMLQTQHAKDYFQSTIDELNKI